MATAVRGLEKRYGQTVRLQVIVRDRKDEAMIAKIKEIFGPSESHGLVAMDGDQAVKGKIPGHQFGMKEILATLKTAL